MKIDELTPEQIHALTVLYKDAESKKGAKKLNWKYAINKNPELYELLKPYSHKTITILYQRYIAYINRICRYCGDPLTDDKTVCGECSKAVKIRNDNYRNKSKDKYLIIQFDNYFITFRDDKTLVKQDNVKFFLDFKKETDDLNKLMNKFNSFLMMNNGKKVVQEKFERLNLTINEFREMINEKEPIIID